MIAVLVKLIHFIVCIGLVVVVLLQADKGEGLAGAFGGGSSNTIFGERGSGGVMTKITTGMAVIFMITSLILSVYLPSWSVKSASGVDLSSRPAPIQTSSPMPMSTEPVAPVAPAAAVPAPVSTPVPAPVAPVAPAPAPAVPAPVVPAGQ
ncbi:MAG TPA: preprotein translocase subunit SecG [Candidatus Ozemobacteraceae bacterium]|nr:preprotein translocase subunit SecG [Candidatus Ozemobacteraceae bacterium]